MRKKKKRTKKNKTVGKAPVIKTRAEMTDEEYTRLSNKAEGRLQEYLFSVASPDMSASSRAKVAGVIAEEFRSRLATEEAFFNKVNGFVNGKQDATPDEKAEFYFGIVQELCRQGRVKRKLAERYPADYRLPENRKPGKKRRVFKDLSGSYR